MVNRFYQVSSFYKAKTTKKLFNLSAITKRLPVDHRMNSEKLNFAKLMILHIGKQVYRCIDVDSLDIM